MREPPALWCGKFTFGRLCNMWCNVPQQNVTLHPHNYRGQETPLKFGFKFGICVCRQVIPAEQMLLGTTNSKLDARKYFNQQV